MITLNDASFDGRVAPGPNRTPGEEIADPENQAHPGAGAVWEQVMTALEKIHHPKIKLQGSGSFVKTNQELKDLPPILNEAPSRLTNLLFYPRCSRPSRMIE